MFNKLILTVLLLLTLAVPSVAQTYKAIEIVPQHAGIFTAVGAQKFTAYGVLQDGRKVDISNQVDWSFKPYPFSNQTFAPATMATVDATGIVRVKSGATWGRSYITASYPKSSVTPPEPTPPPTSDVVAAQLKANAAIKEMLDAMGITNLKIEITSLIPLKRAASPQAIAPAYILTAKTSMTLVTVREWRTGGEGNISKWKQTVGLYNYYVKGLQQFWTPLPYPMPFKSFPNGGSGLMWNVFDEGNKTGNKTYVAWAWDFLGNTTRDKMGGGAVAAEGWYGMMVSTLCRPTNCNGQEKSNLIFTQK